MTYGLPYQGSKNAIAKHIIDILPNGINFLDACCGGGAIIQAAVESGKFKTVTGYDVRQSIIRLLQAVIKGNVIDYEHRPLITNEDFYRMRDRDETLEDSIAIYTASFGYKGTEYLWGKHRQELKYNVFELLMGDTLDKRIDAMSHLIRAIKHGINDKSILVDDMPQLCRNEQVNALRRIQTVENFFKSNETKPVVRVGSMFEIDYNMYDVIYFDPPYENTLKYNRKSFSQIAFKALLQTLTDRGKLVFVSEYKCPLECFECTYEVRKPMTMGLTNTTRIERLFTNKQALG